MQDAGTAIQSARQQAQDGIVTEVGRANDALRQIAENQGRQFQSVLDEALRDYIDRQQKERPRRHAMAAFASSLEEFDSLYRELAK